MVGCSRMTITILSGVKQGIPIAPLLFNWYIIKEP